MWYKWQFTRNFTLSSLWTYFFVTVVTKAVNIDNDASVSTLYAKIFTKFEKTFEYEFDPLATRCTLRIFKWYRWSFSYFFWLFVDSVFSLLFDRHFWQVFLVFLFLWAIISLSIRSFIAPGYFWSFHQISLSDPYLNVPSCNSTWYYWGCICLRFKFLI